MTIRDELDAINAGMARALAEQDAKRFASYYADDARLLSHGQSIIRGRAEIEAEVGDWVTDGPLTLRFETDDVIADGSLAVDVGRIVSPIRVDRLQRRLVSLRATSLQRVGLRHVAG
jgi:uncharacterized protein (TIGR02246 family)